MSNYNGQPWPARVQKSLEEYVNDGGGLVVVHAANNAFEGWPEWNRMIGLGWRNNNFGPRVTVDDEGKVVQNSGRGKGRDRGTGRSNAFKVVVRDKDHPVTKGMPDGVDARDRRACITASAGRPNTWDILATAYSDKSKGGTGTNEPMVWVIPYGKGRVFTTVFGHVGGPNAPAIECVGFQTVVARGAEWAATGKVTLPIPEDFPTADAVRLSKHDAK